MSVTILKTITYNGREYSFVQHDEPLPFCDFCEFSKICQKVLFNQLDYELSPMKICDKIGCSMGMFIPAENAEGYVNSVNNES